MHHRLQRHLRRAAAAEAQQDGALLRRQLAAVRAACACIRFVRAFGSVQGSSDSARTSMSVAMSQRFCFDSTQAQRRALCTQEQCRSPSQASHDALTRRSPDVTQQPASPAAEEHTAGQSPHGVVGAEQVLVLLDRLRQVHGPHLLLALQHELDVDREGAGALQVRLHSLSRAPSVLASALCGLGAAPVVLLGDEPRPPRACQDCHCAE